VNFRIAEKGHDDPWKSEIAEGYLELRRLMRNSWQLVG